MNRQRRRGDSTEIEAGRRRRSTHRRIGDTLLTNMLMSLAGLLFVRPIYSLALAATRVFDSMTQRVQCHALLREQQQERQPDHENTIAGHAEY